MGLEYVVKFCDQRFRCFLCNCYKSYDRQRIARHLRSTKHKKEYFHLHFEKLEVYLESIKANGQNKIPSSSSELINELITEVSKKICKAHNCRGQNSFYIDAHFDSIDIAELSLFIEEQKHWTENDTELQKIINLSVTSVFNAINYIERQIQEVTKESFIKKVSTLDQNESMNLNLTEFIPKKVSTVKQNKNLNLTKKIIEEGLQISSQEMNRLVNAFFENQVNNKNNDENSIMENISDGDLQLMANLSGRKNLINEKYMYKLSDNIDGKCKDLQSKFK